MYMAPRYSYDEVAMARELEKRTGQKFLPELSSTPTHGIPDPNMEQVYLAGGHILLEDNKDENGKTIKTATIRTGIHHFRECHKVILEKCKAAMMRKLGVDQVKFEYR